MTVHDLYPDWVLLKYTSAGRQKRAILPCAIDGAAVPGIEPELTCKGDPPTPVHTCVANYLAVAGEFIAPSSTWDTYEVYHKGTISSPPVFIWGETLGIVGTGDAAVIPYSEIVISFKTPEQGGLKLYFMEGCYPVDVQDAFPLVSDAHQVALADFILGDSNWITGRNGNFPLLGLKITTKQNDFYRRKYKL